MSASRLLASLSLTLAIAGVASAAPFEYVRIGDVDGFGYGNAETYFGADGKAANRGTAGVLGTGDLLPNLNGGQGIVGQLATGAGDDFDNRTGPEIAGAAGAATGVLVNTSRGSQWTDISLSTSFDTTFPGSPNFPGDGIPDTLGGAGTATSNQPGFIFEFAVGKLDVIDSQTFFFNMVFGDYDVVPATLLFTRGDNTTFTGALQTQPGGQDGLIQSGYAELSFADVFTDVGGGIYRGYLRVDFNAPNEPYTAFDFAELSTVPIPLTDVPEPATLALAGLGAVSLAARRASSRRSA